jgi:hypothetical protein
LARGGVKLPSRMKKIDTALSAILVGAVMIGAWFLVAGMGFAAWRSSQQTTALQACYSDRFYAYERAILNLATTNDWKLPKWDSFTNELASVPTPRLPVCESVEKGKLPLIWNSRLTNTAILDSNSAFILCCPPGAHGNYVGALFLKNGTLSKELIHVDELHDRVPAEFLPNQ